MFVTRKAPIMGEYAKDRPVKEGLFVAISGQGLSQSKGKEKTETYKNDF